MNTFQKLKFIETIKHHPELYNKNHISFSDFALKEATWEEIGEKHGISEPKKKWATIRDKFVRLKRLKEQNKLSDVDQKWELFRPMRFLDSFCRRRRSKPNHNMKYEELSLEQDNIEFVSNDNDNDMIDDDDEMSTVDFKVSVLNPDPEMENNSFLDDVNNDEHTTTGNTQEKLKIRPVQQHKKYRSYDDEKYKHLLEKICFEKITFDKQIKNESENMLFMRMIAQKLDTLPPKKKNELQNQILQTVNGAIDEIEYNS